jgi:large subunit ribosomal protein L21
MVHPSTGTVHEEKTMFAVFKTGGKQYRVAAEDVITVAKLTGAPGDIVEFGEVLVLGGENVLLGSPTIAGATVAGEVVDQGRGAKIIAFKKRRRTNSRRKRGHRQEFTVIRITEILTDSQKPTPRPKAEAEPEPQEPAPAETGEAPEAEDTQAAKPKARARPPKKAAAKPKAAKRPARPAAKKPAKRPAASAKGKGASKGKKK